MSPFSSPFFLGHLKAKASASKAAALWEGTQRCKGGTGKGDAKLPDAEISLKLSQENE